MRILIGLAMLCIINTAMAADVNMITLPPPHTTGGMPLLEALKLRHSTREFSAKPVPVQLLSDLLWAADGVNRPASGKRTAPTAMDSREIQIYVSLADGTFLFEPDTHALHQVSAKDLRALTGTQDFAGQAPLNLIYVSDMGHMEGNEESKRFYSATDTGFIAQNVYLFCAATGLETVVRGSIDKKTLASTMGLGPHQQIILAQTIGYPK